MGSGFGILTGIVLFGGLAGCSETRADQATGVARAVRVAPVEEAPPTRTVELAGITRAADRARLSVPVGGRLVERPVRVGDRVSRGDVLARLDPAPWANQAAGAHARVAELEQRLAQLDRDVARLERLDAQGSATATERERLTTERDAVRAGLSGARATEADASRQANDAVLRAPFSGVVAGVFSQPGETVAAGSPIVELSGSGLEVAVELPERIWAQVDGSTAVRVALPALDVELDGVVLDLGASAGGAGGLFPVVIGLPEGERRVAGLTARVQLQLPVQASRVAPVRAIVDPTGLSPAVFVVTDGHARRVPVTVGAMVGERVALDGVPAGSPVVVAGHAQLVDGDAVRVVR